MTAGPTFEPLDDVRRLTNASTGRLGTALANALAVRGHSVLLLRGSQAICRDQPAGIRLAEFSTTDDLRCQLEAQAGEGVGAVFHAAAVSDFGFGRVFVRDAQGQLAGVTSRKFSTRQGRLLVELVPTPKLIARLRSWFPAACLVGWKFEVEGPRTEAVAQAVRQIQEDHLQASVVNGPAYGAGFGLVTPDGVLAHWPDPAGLCVALAQFAEAQERGVAKLCPPKSEGRTL